MPAIVELANGLTRRMKVRLTAPLQPTESAVVIEEAPLGPSGEGIAPQGAGWFVLNARDARWLVNDKWGAYTRFEGEADARFEQVGINISVLQPGQPACLYHGEEDQEDFLVLSGNAVLLVEGQERPLQAWDFFHCPPWTEHVIVGAGDRPCVVIAVGARSHEGVVYPVSELAQRYGAGAEIEHRRGAEGKAGESPYIGYPEDREGDFEEGWL
jgi:uncharacterized cupin superfamily protein